jgi:hypothetical protein
MTFSTDIGRDGDRLVGPWRRPAQMLAEQEYAGHTSVHDDETAARLGLAGAPIEGPTHFSQIDPLAVEHWGPEWFERGCVSSHFLNIVGEGDEVSATLEPVTATLARVDATKRDGTAVLTATASIGEDDVTELDERRRRALEDPGALHIVDQLEIGMTETIAEPVAIGFDDHNGSLYPFTLADKLARITERSSWYDRNGDSPWGGPILPTEMISILAHRSNAHFPVRGPAIGLFVDLEIRYVQGPVFVARPYIVRHSIVGIGQTRRVESYWTESTIVDAERGVHAATVLLHQGVFKASYADYPSG